MQSSLENTSEQRRNNTRVPSARVQLLQKWQAFSPQTHTLWPACVFLLNFSARWGFAIPSRELFSFPRHRHGTQLHRYSVRYILQRVSLYLLLPTNTFQHVWGQPEREKGDMEHILSPQIITLSSFSSFFRDWSTCTVEEKDAENLHCAGKCSQNKSHNHT